MMHFLLYFQKFTLLYIKFDDFLSNKYFHFLLKKSVQKFNIKIKKLLKYLKFLKFYQEKYVHIY